MEIKLCGGGIGRRSWETYCEADRSLKFQWMPHVGCKSLPAY